MRVSVPLASGSLLADQVCFVLDPFGYDKNDLNLDHFTHNIIRVELNALTSRPPPGLSDWAFNPDNTNMFGAVDPGVSPQEWMNRGEDQMRSALRRGEGR